MSGRVALLASALAITAGAQTAGAQTAGAQTLTVLQETGPREHRLNVVFVAEGYTAGQTALFETRARQALGLLLQEPPYDRYGDLFNAYAVFVASNEAGSDHPSRNEYRDTAFDTYYDCADIERLICVGDGGALLETLVTTIPTYDIVIVLVNDPQYGGSGGTWSVSSAHEAAPAIAVHEVGHSFAGLADEYGGTQSGFTSVNTSVTARRGEVPWSFWVHPSTPLPTPDTGAARDSVGAFLGAAYSDTGAYRPQHECGMRSLNVPFCAVCHEHHIGAIYRQLSPLGVAEPAEGAVEVADAAVTFRVAPLAPPETRAVEWLLNGTPLPGGAETLALSGADLPAGTSTLELRVTDGTPAVRDPALLPLLRDARTWTLTNTATPSEGDPDGAWLGVPFPNPSAGTVRVPVRLDVPGPLRVTVLDALGRTVAVLADEPQLTGTVTLTWHGAEHARGVYLVRLETDRTVATQRVTIAR